MSATFDLAGQPRQPDAARVRRGRAAAGASPRAVLILLAIVALPSLPMFFGVATSMAVGVMLVCLGALAALAVEQSHAPMWPSRRVALSLVVCLMLSLHALVATALQRVDLVRFALSLVLLATFLMAAIALSNLLFSVAGPRLHRAIRWVLAVLVVVGLLGLAGVSPPSPIKFSKPVFPFTEPSHFALSVMPLYLYFAVTTRGARRLLALSAGLVFALVLQNMTLLVSALLVLLVCARPFTLVVIAIPVVLTVPFLDFEYFASRLDFSPESDNLSVLVFIQGWQLIEESLRNSHYWGLGFQQLGAFGTNVEFADLIYTLIGDNSNLSDGGFTLSKLVSEFGLLGMVLAGVHFYAALRCGLMLRKVASRRLALPVGKVLACAVVVAFSVDMLIRGNGYFTASSLFYLVAVMHLVAERKRRGPARPRPPRPAMQARPGAIDAR